LVLCPTRCDGRRGYPIQLALLGLCSPCWVSSLDALTLARPTGSSLDAPFFFALLGVHSALSLRTQRSESARWLGLRALLFLPTRCVKSRSALLVARALPSFFALLGVFGVVNILSSLPCWVSSLDALALLGLVARCLASRSTLLLARALLYFSALLGVFGALNLVARCVEPRSALLLARALPYFLALLGSLCTALMPRSTRSFALGVFLPCSARCARRSDSAGLLARCSCPARPARSRRSMLGLSLYLAARSRSALLLCTTRWVWCFESAR
jgi:hypothetical protein